MNSLFPFGDNVSEEEGELTLLGHVTWAGVGMHGWDAFLNKHYKPTNPCNTRSQETHAPQTTTLKHPATVWDYILLNKSKIMKRAQEVPFYSFFVPVSSAVQMFRDQLDSQVGLMCPLSHPY